MEAAKQLTLEDLLDGITEDQLKVLICMVASWDRIMMSFAEESRDVSRLISQAGLNLKAQSLTAFTKRDVLEELIRAPACLHLVCSGSYNGVALKNSGTLDNDALCTVIKNTGCRFVFLNYGRSFLLAEELLKLPDVYVAIGVSVDLPSKLAVEFATMVWSNLLNKLDFWAAFQGAVAALPPAERDLYRLYCKKPIGPRMV